MSTIGHMSTYEPDQAQAAVRLALCRLYGYIEHTGTASYDPYDLMATRFGKFARRGYYEKSRRLFTPVVAALQAADLFLPRTSRRLFAERTAAPEAVTYLARANLDMYLSTEEPAYLIELRRLIGLLEDSAARGYAGACWGLPFDWQMSALIGKGTPCVTISATAALLLRDAAEVLSEPGLTDTANSTARFIMENLNTDDGLFSYTPLDRVYVVNANAYAADLLVECGAQTGNEAMARAGERTLDAVLGEQRDDGSWTYYFRRFDEGGRNFIDCFHTCFVIETLIRISNFIDDPRLDGAIQCGLSFLLDNFIGLDGDCRHYLTYHSPHFIKMDMRSCAEAIRVLTIAADIRPEAMTAAVRVALRAIEQGQMADGSFRYRLHVMPTPAISYHRWSNGPMLAALAGLDRSLTEISNSGTAEISRSGTGE